MTTFGDDAKSLIGLSGIFIGIGEILGGSALLFCLLFDFLLSEACQVILSHDQPGSKTLKSRTRPADPVLLDGTSSLSEREADAVRTIFCESSTSSLCLMFGELLFPCVTRRGRVWDAEQV